MSEAVMQGDPMVTTQDDKPSFLKWKWMFTLLAVIVGGGVWATLMFGGDQFALNGFMYGYIFWVAATLGCLALTLLHGSINSSWTLATLRIFEAGCHPLMFAALGFFFIPVRAHMDKVYDWVKPETHDKILEFKRAYLTLGGWKGFDARFIFFLGLMAFMSYMMQRSSQRQDKSMADKERQFRTNFGTPGLVVLALIITFFLTDIAMSLTPHWYSTIYPLWLMVGGCQTALALAIVLVCSNADKQPYKDSMSPALTRDLGNMMFVLTMLWGYTSVSQLIILWNGNLPDTAIFYAVRGSDAKLGWNFVGASTILGCFFIPFSSLLSTRLKRYAKRVRNVALFILFFRFVDVFWIIAASVPHRQWNNAMPTAWDAIGLVAMGLVWFAVMLYRVDKAPLLPLYDNRLKEAKANAH